MKCQTIILAVIGSIASATAAVAPVPTAKASGNTAPPDAFVDPIRTARTSAFIDPIRTPVVIKNPLRSTRTSAFIDPIRTPVAIKNPLRRTRTSAFIDPIRTPVSSTKVSSSAAGLEKKDELDPDKCKKIGTSCKQDKDCGKHCYCDDFWNWCKDASMPIRPPM